MFIVDDEPSIVERIRRKVMAGVIGREDNGLQSGAQKSRSNQL